MVKSQLQSRIAIGQMSGTSLDGIDVAIIETTAHELKKRIGAIFIPYPDYIRDALFSIIGAFEEKTTPDVRALVEEVTDLNINAIKSAIKEFGIKKESVDVIGFHGQTVWHDPIASKTIQLGDGERIAKELSIDVVYDFRSNDMLNGGQGAPLAPLYHHALFKKLGQPVVAMNIGGVGNLTYIDSESDSIIAFDFGPGNALIDDAMRHFGLGAFDKDGAIAATGSPSFDWIETFLEHPFFAEQAPKSLDRTAFNEVFHDLIGRKLSVEDTIATATFAPAAALRNSLRFLPKKVGKWIVCGGGRHNSTLIQFFADEVSAPIFNCDAWGLNGDTLEAEAFAYLAVRSLEGLPLSLPSTTGCKKPTTGGVIVRI